MEEDKASADGPNAEKPQTYRTVIRFIDGKPIVVERASFRPSKRQIAAFLSVVLGTTVFTDDTPDESVRAELAMRRTVRRGVIKMRETPGRSRRMMRRRNLTPTQPSGLGGIGSLPLEWTGESESKRE